MAIKGTDIVKKLPEGGKKNCRECGFPTCFAFAMKLSTGSVDISKCKYLSDETRDELQDTLAPPMKLVTIGTGEESLHLGNEEVLYRHEKTFVHAPGIALLIDDTETDEVISGKIDKLTKMQFQWVGQILKADLLALWNKSGDKAAFITLVKKVCDATSFPLMLMADDANTLIESYDLCYDKKPLLYAVTDENIEAIINGIKQHPVPVVAKASGIEDLIPLTIRLKEAGIDEIILDPVSINTQEIIKNQTLIRRAALKQNFRPLGYPTLTLPCFMTDDPEKEILIAALSIIKYAGIIVLSDIKPETLLPLLVQRLNIYTDPRIPMAVEEKLYQIGEPTVESPVLITSNWALTYFLVASEIESSKIASWLCVKATEGLGVLTGWAAGKFSGDSIGPLIKKLNIENIVSHKKIVIPGSVARIKGEIEEALPGWEVIVGPKEAGDIPAYLPALVRKWKTSAQ